VNMAKALWAAIEGDPQSMQKLHGWATILWFIAAFPIMWFWSDSVPLVVFLSVYAIVTGHWSSYQASRVEVKQDQEGEA